MTTAQDYAKTLRIASGAERHQALVDSIMTPELRKLMQEQGKRMSEALNLQVRVRDVLPPSMEALMREQIQRIAEMINTSGMRKALAGINFNLPDGWAEQVAAYREQLAEEVAGDQIEDAGGGSDGSQKTAKRSLPAYSGSDSPWRVSAISRAPLSRPSSVTSSSCWPSSGKWLTKSSASAKTTTRRDTAGRLVAGCSGHVARSGVTSA